MLKSERLGAIDSQVRGLDDTQKEAVSQQTRSVGADSCQRRDDAPDNHLSRRDCVSAGCISVDDEEEKYRNIRMREGRWPACQTC